MERLSAYAWPGNVRELQSILKQAMLHATGTLLIPSFLPQFFSPETQTAAAAASGGGSAFDFEDFTRRRLEAGSTDLHAEAHLELDRILLPAALRFTNGNQNQAAKVLGLARQTLRLRLRELGLQLTKTVADENDTDG